MKHETRITKHKTRVTIIVPTLRAHDAVGNYVQQKLKLLREFGFEAKVVTEQVDLRVSKKVRRATFEVPFNQLWLTHAELRGLPAPLRGLVEHFYSSSLVFFDYPIYHPLMESIKLMRGAVKVFDYHGVTPPQFFSAEQQLVMKQSVKETSLVAHADFAITHSQFMKRELSERFGFPEEKIFVLPYAVALENFSPAPKSKAIVQQFSLEGCFVLLYVGRMAPNKKIEHIVEALPLVLKEHPNVKLLLVGRAGEFPEVISRAHHLIHKNALQDKVVFVGEVAHDDLKDYYNLADVFVIASEHEGFCIPVIEAMACGVPVVAANATALPETVGDAGLLFEPGDISALASHIVRLLNDLKRLEHLKAGKLESMKTDEHSSLPACQPASLYQRLSHAGRERAKLFSEQAFTERFQGILQSIGAFSLTPRKQPVLPETVPLELQFHAAERDLLKISWRAQRPPLSWVLNALRYLFLPILSPWLSQQSYLNTLHQIKVHELEQKLQSAASLLEEAREESRKTQERLSSLASRLSHVREEVQHVREEVLLSLQYRSALDDAHARRQVFEKYQELNPLLSGIFIDPVQKRRLDALLSLAEEAAGHGARDTGHGTRMLEVGCADGYITSTLTKRGHQVVGVDISVRQLQNGIQPGTYVGADAFALPFRDGSFDCVLMPEVLEHLPRPEEALKEAVRVCKGTIVITVPTGAGAQDGQPNYSLDPTHIHLFTKETLRQLFRNFSELAVSKEVEIPQFLICALEVRK